MYTAIVTPFTDDGESVDWAQLDVLVEHQIAGGIDGLVPCGTTGESPTLSHAEKEAVIAAVVKKVARRVPVFAGTGSNSTRDSVAATESAKRAGCDGVLIVNPYYNKPTQEGLYQHIKAIAAVDIPIMLYNIPGRTACTLDAATVARCYRDFPQVVAVKEATGSLDMATEIASLCDITIMSGDDTLTVPLMAVGARGVVSVLSNLQPALMKGKVDAMLAGRYDDARKLHLQHFKLCKTMFVETNPIPIKAAMKMAGVLSGEALRLPMSSISADNRAKLQACLREYSIVA